MEVVFFSGIPFFPQRVTGGAQKILGDVARYLGQVGHRVRILSPARPECDRPFALGEGVEVLPLLPVQRFPEVCATAPYNLTHLILDTQRILASADVLYILDAVLPFAFLYRDLATVQSFHNFSYSDTLANGLSFRRDRLLLNSDYVRGCVIDTMSPFCPAIADRITVVPNGFDLDVLRPVDAQPLAARLGLPEDAIPVLYPHRPDPRKGIYEAIDAVAMLRQRWGGKGDRLRLLIPEWSDGAAENDSDTYAQIRRYARDRDAAHLLLIHPWITVAEMPAYYSLGRVSLCLGTVPETFGNVPLESIACGTPAIVARVAAYRTTLPESLVAKVDPGDVIGAANALDGLLSDPPDPAIARRYVAEHYSHKQMVRGYEQVLTQTHPLAPLPDCPPTPWHPSDRLAVPTWCYRGDRGYYNDYHYGYVRDPALRQLLDRTDLDAQTPITVEEAEEGGLLTYAELDGLVRSGALVRRSRSSG